MKKCNKLKLSEISILHNTFFFSGQNFHILAHKSRKVCIGNLTSLTAKQGFQPILPLHIPLQKFNFTYHGMPI